MMTGPIRGPRAATGPCETGPHGTRRCVPPRGGGPPDHAVAADVATARAAAAGPAVRGTRGTSGFRASGRISLGRIPLSRCCVLERPAVCPLVPVPREPGGRAAPLRLVEGYLLMAFDVFSVRAPIRPGGRVAYLDVPRGPSSARHDAIGASYRPAWHAGGEFPPATGRPR